MSKKSEHKKRVAARNQRMNGIKTVNKIVKEIEKSGKATPNEARIAAVALAKRGINPMKMFGIKGL